MVAFLLVGVATPDVIIVLVGVVFAAGHIHEVFCTVVSIID